MKANRGKIQLSLLTLALVLGGLVSHKTNAAEEKKRATIDFEDELVEGELKKPELFYLLQKKQFNYKRLIKLRENFLPEMRRDAEEMRGSARK